VVPVVEETTSTEVDSQWSPTAITPIDVSSDIQVEMKSLFSYLKLEKYTDFANQEAETHLSAGPHTKFGLPAKIFYYDKWQHQ